MAKKKLTDILGENYLDNYSQKTEVGKSFVAMHRDGTIHDYLGDKGKTEGQFKSDKPPAPYKKAPQKGFPAEGKPNDYNLPTYYDDADKPEEDEDDKKRSHQVTEEEDDGDNEEDTDVAYLKLSELDARGIVTRYAHKAQDGSNKELTPNRQKGIALAHLKKWGSTDYGLPTAKVPAVWDRGQEKNRNKFLSKKATDAPKSWQRVGRHKEDVHLTSFKDHLNEAAATRKHFVNVANTVRAIENPGERQKFADHHAGIFAQANPKFDHARFHAHAGTSFTPPKKPKKRSEDENDNG